MRKYLIFLLLISFFSSCISDLDKYLDSEHPKLVKVSEIKGKGEFKPEINISDNMMVLSVAYRNPDFLISRNSNENMEDTFTYQISVVFYSDNKPIPLAPSFSSYVYNPNLLKNNTVTFFEVSYWSRNTLSARIQVPMYYFNHLPQGKNSVMIGVYCHKKYKSTDGLISINEMLSCGYYRFQMNIPEIYSTKLICYGLELQNDSIWSPYNSDFSFGKGLPDVYWTISTPAENEKDYSHFYATTPVQWNSYGYTGTDTIEILSYKPNQNLIIGVNDYDRVFSDDYLGSWFGSIEDLEKSNSDGYISFIHTKRFDYKLISPVCINSKKKSEDQE